MPDKSQPRIRRTRTEKPATAGRPGKGSGAVGAFFRSAREEQGLSQEQVAELTSDNLGEVSRSTIGDIERGRSLPNLESLVSLSRVLHLDPSEVLERVEITNAVPVDVTGVTYEELAGKAERFYWARDFRSALGVYDAMLGHMALAPAEDKVERNRRHSKIEINRAVVLRQLSALKAAEASAKRAVDLSSAFPEFQAEAYMVLASLYSHDGLLTLALDTIDRAVILAADANDRLKGQTLSQKGNVLHRSGKYAEARQVFLEARKFALRAGDHHNIIGLEGNIGSCLLELGRVSQGRARLVKAVDLARKHRDPAFEASWLIELAELTLRDGDPEEADRIAQNALRLSKGSGRVLTEFRAEWLRFQATRALKPRATDARRLARLRKLYTRVKNHRGLAVIQEFKTAILDNAGSGK